MTDKTQDLILGVLGGPWVGLKYPGVEAYLTSTQRSGFSGRKVMIVWSIQPVVRQKLKEYGFELVERNSLHSGYDGDVHRGNFFHDRMHVCRDYMRDHWKEFRYVFFLDVKDLILQSDPSIWMENNLGENCLVASNECVNISQEETNKLWAQGILGESKYQEIKDCEVINGGTWAGIAEAMAEVFHQVHTGCQTYKGTHPPCQIWINYVLHTVFKKDLYIPRWSEGFAACLHPCWSPWRVPCWPNLKDVHPVLQLDTCTLYAGTVPDPKNQMIVFNPHWGTTQKVQFASPSDPLKGVECVEKPKGKPFAIVHGADRDWDVKSLFDFRYRFDGKFDLKEYMLRNEALPAPRRALRRANEGTISGSELPQSRRFSRRH